MTMHLLRGASSLNTRKSRSRLTKTKVQELELAWRKYNKDMKISNNRALCFNTLDDYIDYCFGKTKTQKEFKPYVPQTTTARRETHNYPSASISPSATTTQSSTARKESQRYTGTFVKGISTMHKSNAVPIISRQEAIDHAKMSR